MQMQAHEKPNPKINSHFFSTMGFLNPDSTIAVFVAGIKYWSIYPHGNSLLKK